MNFFNSKKINFLYISSLPLSFLVPVIVLLLFNNEYLLSLVSISLYLIILGISIPVMLTVSMVFRNSKHIILSLIMFLFIYVMFFPTNAPKIDFIPFGEIGSALTILILLLSLFTLLKQNIEKIVLIILIITLITVILFPDRSERGIHVQTYASKNITSNIPDNRYVHIILDQHIGIDGLLLESDKDQHYVDALMESYQKYKFNIYPKAYSKFYQTKLSLPSILNFSKNGEILINNYESEPPYIKLTKNKLFDYLAKNNYQINVYGDYLGWCNEIYPINKCLRYRKTILFNENESNINKILFVIDNLLTRYRIINIYNRISGLKFQGNFFLPRYSWNPPVVDKHTTASLEVFKLLENDILNSKKGEAFFAHLLFPHSPYIYDENCNLLDLSKLRKNDVPYSRYFSQIKCSQKKVVNLIEQMSVSGILKDSVVVIHSDHGPYELESNDDDKRKWQKYSSFFAVHTDKNENMIDQQVQDNFFPIASLLGSLIENDLNSIDHTNLLNNNINNVFVFDPSKMQVKKFLLEEFSKGHTINKL